MSTIELLRQFRILDYAVFDFAVSFLGIYLLSPLLTKLFKKIRLDIPKLNWVFLTLPIGILSHLLVGSITPMTQDFFDISDHYILKIVMLVLLFFGIKGIKIIKNGTIPNGKKV